MTAKRAALDPRLGRTIDGSVRREIEVPSTDRGVRAARRTLYASNMASMSSACAAAPSI
ncbi:hypothetical protein [Polaromonas sp.]|uniref:hypothetical protein n=1 Tax=Polaromonas sp. TaxID=1869339 RepID=UPI00352B165A